MKEGAGYTDRFFLLFSSMMILLYIAAGITLIFLWQPESIPRLNSRILGLILVLYALFRIRRLVRSIKKSGNHE